MLVSLKNFKTTVVIATALLLSANGYAISAGDDSALTTDLSKIYSEGLPNTEFKGTMPDVSIGSDATLWEYEHDDDSINAKYGKSIGTSVDFSNDLVNTGGEETITVMDVSLGIKGDISLGCNGLDMGLEALFEFDAGEILEYLPQYIMTNLAVEALAQIYATPLVSTIMDGLKSMQNFVAEFKQSSCDMNKVMDRANEIKAANYNECLAEIGDGRRDGMPAEKYCSSPHGLNKKLKEYQKRFSTWSPMSDALTKIFPESLGTEAAAAAGTEKDYDGPQKDENGDYVKPQGRIPSKGRILAMFIPDVKFSATKNKSDITLNEYPKLSVSDTYQRTTITAKNFITGMYKDMKKSFRKKNIVYNSEQQSILELFDVYKDYLVNLYGTQKNYDDDDDDNDKKRKPEEIKKIKQQYAGAYLALFTTARTKSGHKGFIIGPEEGPVGGKTIASSETDLQGIAKEVLELGDTCWVKMKSGTDDKYKWTKVQKDLKSVFNVPAKTIEELIDNVTKCYVASTISMLHYSSRINTLEDNSLRRAYLDMIATRAAENATRKIIQSVNIQSDSAVASNKDRLRKQCLHDTNQGVNMGNVEKVAVYGEKEKQQFKNCDDYADQMKLSEDKEKFLASEKEKRNVELEEVKEDADYYEKQYYELVDLYKTQDEKR